MKNKTALILLVGAGMAFAFMGAREKAPPEAVTFENEKKITITADHTAEQPAGRMVTMTFENRPEIAEKAMLAPGGGQPETGIATTKKYYIPGSIFYRLSKAGTCTNEPYAINGTGFNPGYYISANSMARTCGLIC